MTLRRELETEMRAAYTKCMDGATPGGLGLRSIQAFAELLQEAHSADPDTTRHYLSLFVNRGPLANDKLGDLAGGFQSQALEKAKEHVASLRVGQERERALLDAPLLVLRFEMCIRPMLLATTGLLRIARHHHLPKSSPRQRALALAETTLLEKHTAKGRVTWQGRGFGAATKGLLQELPEARKAAAIGVVSHQSLLVLAKSVGLGGGRAMDGSTRAALDNLRNTVNHGDFYALDDGHIELFQAAAWRTWVKTGKTRRAKKTGVAHHLDGAMAAEGLLCVSQAFQAGCRKLAGA
jgi:hypothetical protein